MISIPDYNARVQFFIGLTNQHGANLDYEGTVSVIANVMAVHNIDGFNVALTNGYWKGAAEASLVVTVFSRFVGLPSQIEWPHHVAALLAQYLDQECVLVDVVHANAHLVGGAEHG